MSERLAIDGLEVNLAGRQVLREVCLDVRGGELVALIGANGCGKTTLLNAVCGHLRADRGSVAVDGHPIGDCSARDWARRVAVVPQVYELPFGFTVAELVAMGRHSHIGLFGGASPEDETAVRQALQALALEPIAQRQLQRLSGGERQMVVLAMAFAQQPRLLLLDEPTTHLDIRHEAIIMDAVRAACDEQGLAALAVIHDLRLARRYCDRAALLHGGRITAHGAPDEVLSPARLAACFGVEPSFFEGDGAPRRSITAGGR